MCAKARHGNEKQVREAFEDLGGQGPRSQLVHDGDQVHELAPQAVELKACGLTLDIRLGRERKNRRLALNRRVGGRRIDEGRESFGTYIPVPPRTIY